MVRVANIDLQNRAPEVTRTPDFRNHIERKYAVLNNVAKTPAEVLAECWLPLGTVDELFTNAYLIEQKIVGQMGPYKTPVQEPPYLLRVFEELNGLNETQIGSPSVVMDQYGNRSVIFTYWQLNLGTSTYQVPGVTTAPSPFEACFLKTEERANDGTLRKIVRTYIDSGELSDTEQLRFGGKVVVREVKTIGIIPNTPTGWSLVTTSIDFINGRQVYTYGFVNGGGGGAGAGGVISNDVRYGESDDQGVIGTTLTTIKQISAQDVVSNPITGPAGQVLINLQYEDDTGYRMWTAEYAKGAGLVSIEIHARQDGLREVTYLSLGTRIAPSTGESIRDDYQKRDGFTLFTVTVIQSSDGFAPTSGTVVFERYVPFVYPGRAKAYHVTASNGWVAYDVYKSPPVGTQVKGVVTVTYQASNSLGLISNYWNPKEWACIDAQWIGLSNIPGFAIGPLPGYRSVDNTEQTFTASPWEGGLAGTMLGNPVYGGTTALLRVSGGPSDPGGHTFVLDATIEPAFTSVTGVKYYRKTIVTATIPTQAALPV